MSDYREISASDSGGTANQDSAYAMAVEQTIAIFALEQMTPLPHDNFIATAIVAGKISPRRAHDELLAYIIKHKTVKGFRIASIS